MDQLFLSILALVLASLALMASVWSLILANKLRIWRKIFGPEQQNDNLEEVITSITESLNKLNHNHARLSEETKALHDTLQTTFRYSSVVRFDSGSNDGGNLSFVLALLNGSQTGVIITSLHGRQHNRIYCKAIVDGRGQQELSEEEQEALIQALTSKPQIKKQKR